MRERKKGRSAWPRALHGCGLFNLLMLFGVPWLHSAFLKTAKLRLQNASRRCAAHGQQMRGVQSACVVWRPLASIGFP